MNPKEQAAIKAAPVDAYCRLSPNGAATLVWSRAGVHMKPGDVWERYVLSTSQEGERICHERNLQERERGQEALIAGLRASNKALTAEVHKLREQASDSRFESMDALDAKTGGRSVDELLKEIAGLEACRARQARAYADLEADRDAWRRSCQSDNVLVVQRKLDAALAELSAANARVKELLAGLEQTHASVRARRDQAQTDSARDDARVESQTLAYVIAHLRKAAGITTAVDPRAEVNK